MKPMTLNLSKMKKIASDKKTSTFQHDDGHKMVILHSALPHLQRKALEKMPLHKGEEKPEKLAFGGITGNPLITNAPAAPLPVAAAFQQAPMDTSGPKIEQTPAMPSLGDWSSGIEPKEKKDTVKPAGTDLSSGVANNEFEAAAMGAQPGQYVQPGSTTMSSQDWADAMGAPKYEGGEVEKPKKKSEDYLSEASHNMADIEKPYESTAQEGGGLAKTISDYFKANGGLIEQKKFEEHKRKLENFRILAPQPVMMKDGGDPADAPAKNDAEAAAMGATPDQQASNPNHITINVGQPQTPGTQTIPAIANAPTQTETAPIDTQQKPVASYGTQGGITKPAENEKLAEQQLQEAGQEKVGIQSEEAKLAAERAKGTIQGIKEIQDQHAANIAEVQKPVQDYAEHIAKTPADADRYLTNMSDGKRIRTAIGLFLGGLSVPFGGHNTTLDMLNKAIDRDVEEQKRDAGNKQTLFNAYFKLYGNKELAANAAKQSLMDIVAQKANIDAARLGTANAMNQNKVLQATANQAKNDLSLKNGAILGDLKNKQGAQPQPTESDSNGDKTPKASNTSIHDQQRAYTERNLRPGSKEVPYTPPPQLIKVDYDAINNHKRNKELGLLGSMDEGEVTQADRESKDAEAANQALKEIHKQYQVMWKNGADADILGNFLSDQHLAGFKLPDLSKLTPSQRNFYTAASSVEKQIGNAIKGGLNEHVSKLIQDQLPHKGDSPDQYREKLMNLDNILRQPLNGGVLRRRKLATGLPE